MFVISIKKENLKKILFALFTMVVTLIGGTLFVFNMESTPVAKVGNINMKAESNEERVAFFSQFSLKANDEPIEIKEIVVPEEFDETYNSYNELQKKQGLDLTPYKGVKLKYYSYNILNYPNYEETDGIIRGNLLVYNGTIVGGDICSNELSGFMTTFDSKNMLKESTSEVTES